MIRLPRIAALLSTLPLALGAALVAAEDVEVDATIQAVNAEDRSLVVEFEETGVTQKFRVDTDTEISFEGIRSEVRQLRSGFDDLRAGQEVTLRFDDEAMQDDWFILHVITVS